MKTTRLYYDDTYLRSFTATVVEQTAAPDGRTELILDRTAFYPTSGGQPHDTGFIDGIPVLDVIDRGDQVVHVVANAIEDRTTEVNCQIDWGRRLDHAQQHSGQHVLSQAFDSLHSAKTVSFHLGVDSSTIDISRPGLSETDVLAVENLANRIVLENRPIAIHYADSDDLDRFGLRKATERSGQIRVIEIDGFDASACGGTHLNSTGGIGTIKVTRWERRGNDTRVEFVCGNRAIADYSLKHEIVKAMANRFRVRDVDVLSTVDRVAEENDSRRKHIEVLNDALLGFEAAELVANAQTAGGVSFVLAVVTERSADALKRLTQRVTATGRVVGLLGAPSGARASLVFAQSPGLSHDMGKLLRETCLALGGRGGGSIDLAQGGIPDAGLLAQALASARANLEA